MKVFALVGKSGTGKSFQAMTLCGKKDINAIIDDGLFIYDGTIMEGISAKRQVTKIGAIKTALFTDEEHRESVARKIGEVSPEKIMLLGTSEGMVRKIAEKLGLPGIEELIYIEDITTEHDREIAYKQRYELGKHVIPVPTVQLKNHFSGYFLHPIRMFKGLNFGGTKDNHQERSVVRPTYSYLGEFFISDKAVRDIVNHLGRKNHGVEEIHQVHSQNTPTGVEMTVILSMKYGSRVMECAELLQHEIREKVAEMTAFNVERVDLEVKALV